MGHMIEQVALERGHEVVCVIEPNLSPDLSAREGAEIYSPEEGFASEAFRNADVAIEFTTPHTAEENIRRAWAQGVPVVCGSTGISKPTPDPSLKGNEEGNQWVVRDEAGKIRLVWSSNYSVGVNIFFDLNRFLAKQIKTKGEDLYTPSITETHHIHKLDKPSGTAKTLANQIESLSHREGEQSPITSIREGEVPGTHTVLWDSEEDTIVITHIAKGRRGFALGAVMTAEEVVERR